MSRIDDLIQELCPDGVKYQPLAEITARVTDGSHNPPKASDGGIYPMISAKNISDGRINFVDARMLSSEDYEAENRRTAIAVGDVLLTIVGAIGRSAVVETDSPMVFQRSVAVIKPKRDRIIPRFLQYVIGSTRLQRYIDSQANGAAQKGLYLKQVEKLRIPMPPLEVQREIVRVLDKFTQLEAELEAELEARRAQYEVYRRALLDAEDSDSRAPLGDLLISVRVPKGVKRTAYGDGSAIPIIDQGKSAIAGYTDDDSLRVPAGEYIIFGDHTRAVKWVDHDFAPGADGTRVFRAREGVLPRYAFFAFQQLEIPSRGYNRHWTVAREMTVPVPNLKRQREIVAILDYFDALVNDISIGLPSELAARRRQYVHYRDRLLTFKELAS